MITKQKQIFDFIRYANVWEDADLLCNALIPAAQDGRILSISSSGDNVQALLTLDPKEIVAVDFSFPQLACLEIRIAAFKKLDHLSLCEFLGILPSKKRVEIYQNLLKDTLNSNTITFWDQNLSEIRNGIIHAGKFERYLQLFGKWILPLIHSQTTIKELLNEKNQDQRKNFYEKKWDRWGWRLLFKIFFSRFVMGRAGRDPSFFRHVEGPVSGHILNRTKFALTELSTHNNPYLSYILNGNFSMNALPCYLRPENFDAIQSRVDRIKLVQGPIEQVKGSFDAFNLSDVFEYMDESEFERCYQKIVDLANPKARIAYWNMLVPRSCPKDCLAKISPLIGQAAILHSQDKAWFYQKFVVEERLP
jgi:S-adenosylmethionine-diacylglycerol 3-amino-3-carboxypropyl transferase